MVYFSVTGGFKAGGFNPASPAGSEAYDEEHTWNYRGRPQERVGRAPGHGQPRGVLDRLAGSPAQSAEPAGAGAVLHLERRQGAQQRRRVRAERPATADGVASSPRFGVTRARFGAGTTSSGRRRVGQEDPEHAGLHGGVRRRPVAPALVRAIGSTAAPRSCSTARSSTTTTTWRGRTRTRSRTSASARAATRVFVGRLDPERVRHELHPGRVPVRPEARAVGVHRRERAAADVRHHRRSHVLSGDAGNSQLRNSATPNERPTPNAQISGVGSSGVLGVLGVGRWELIGRCGVVKLGID